MVNIKIRNVVIALLGLSVLYLLFFIPKISQTLVKVFDYISTHGTMTFYLTFIVSVLLLLLGHFIRSYRSKFVFSVASETDVNSQFKAFTIGSLLNSIIPFRAGDFFRADILAQKYKISFSFSFVLVLIERFIDAIVIFLSLIILFGYVSVSLSIFLIVLVILLVLLFVLPVSLRKLLMKIFSVFNADAEAKLLFITWTSHYGLKRLITIKNFIFYISTSVVNWAVYFLALFPILFALKHVTVFEAIKLSLASFYAVSANIFPSGLGTYTSTLTELVKNSGSFAIIIWLILIIPTALIGLIFVVTQKNLKLFRENSKIVSVTTNKLQRENDISKEQVHFLRGYFSGNPVPQRISDLDVKGTTSLTRFLVGGGSQAATILTNKDGHDYVAKMIPIKISQSLREQFNWLHRYDSPNITKAVFETEENGIYSIYIDYDKTAVDGFDYVHTHSLFENKEFYKKVLDTLKEQVYGHLTPVSAEKGCENVNAYIQKHIYTCLKLASETLPFLADIYKLETIKINGIEYKNGYRLISEIENNPKILNDLANYRKSNVIHGDLILDNLIWSEEKQTPMIIDPVPEGNMFDGPVFDFGKLAQSLWCGYEFLLRDTTKVELKENNTVEYKALRSETYQELWEYVYYDLAKDFLTESELRTVLFIGATNFFRRLKHQAQQFPQNTLKFYAIGVIYLNKYLEQFNEL